MATLLGNQSFLCFFLDSKTSYWISVMNRSSFAFKGCGGLQWRSNEWQNKKNRTHSYPQRVYNLEDTQNADEISSYVKQPWIKTMTSDRAKNPCSKLQKASWKPFLIFLSPFYFSFFLSFTSCFVWPFFFFYCVLKIVHNISQESTMYFGGHLPQCIRPDHLQVQKHKIKLSHWLTYTELLIISENTCWKYSESNV